MHALQNHDEITYELVPPRPTSRRPRRRTARPSPSRKTSVAIFAPRCAAQGLDRAGESDRSANLERKPNAFFNKESSNGLCTTIPGLHRRKASAARSLDEAATRKAELILQRPPVSSPRSTRSQPGVFALSGWDLVGALPVPECDLPQVLLNAGDTPREADKKDYRWVNRGAYRLLSTFGEPTPGSAYGVFALPEAQALYGPLDKQREDPASFFHQMRRLLELRVQLDLPVAQFHGTLTQPGTGVFGFRLSTTEKTIRHMVIVLFNFAAPGTDPVPCDLQTMLQQNWPAAATPDNDVHLHQHCPDGTNGWTHWKPEDPVTLQPWDWKLLRFTPIAKES